MEVSMRGTLKKASSMAKASIAGLIHQLTMETGQITTSRVMELTSGLMEDSTLEAGRRINCMARVDTLGKMEGATRVSILMIRKRDSASMSGQMEGNMKVGGEMASNMAKEDSLTQKAKVRKESGKKEKESDGLKGAKRIEILLVKPLKQLRILQHPLISHLNSEIPTQLLNHIQLLNRSLNVLC